MKDKTFSELIVEYLPVEALAPHLANARTHSKRQIQLIAKSIEAVGFANPAIIDGKNQIIAGHGRIAAAKLLGIEKVPCIRLEGLTEAQLRAYMIADNVLAAKAGWDKEILAIELQNLLDIDTNFDITTTGFEVPEVDLVIKEAGGEGDEDPVPEKDENTPAVSRPGDTWILGKHKILCSNAMHEASYEALMVSSKAATIFADPPFNVPIDGHVSGTGKIHHREFAMGVGEMSEAEFVAFLTTFMRLTARHSTDGSLHYICMDWRHMDELLAAGRQVYSSLFNLCVWAKDNGGMGTFYRSRHELIFVFKNGTAKHRNNVQLGRYGRNRSNVWEYPCARTTAWQGEEGSLPSLHPTVKPVALVADALLDATAQGEIVLDPFLGSGTTLMAAERTGRTCHGMELDPLYVDLAIRRWQKNAGGSAVHAATGKSFDELSKKTEANHG